MVYIPYKPHNNFQLLLKDCDDKAADIIYINVIDFFFKHQ